MHYGHASANCQLKTRCSYCGANHTYKNCPHNPNNTTDDLLNKNGDITDNAEITDSNSQSNKITKPVCCNCGKNHLAISEECPQRNEYKLLQKSISSNRHQKNNSSSYQNRQQQQQQFNSSNNRNFSQINNNTIKQQYINKANNSIDLKAALSMNYNQNKKQTYAEATQSADLFSFEDINKLIQEIINNLIQCNNKAEQFNVIAQLAVKYLYGK